MTMQPPVEPKGSPSSPRERPTHRPMWRRARVLAPLAFLAGLGFGAAGADDTGTSAPAAAPLVGLTAGAVPPRTVTETETQTETETKTRTKTETETRTKAAIARAPSRRTQAPSAYYANCDAARAAGAAPVYAGDPGYGRHLDRDGDGAGCE